MKKTFLLCIALTIATATIITGCEQEKNIISNTEEMKVQIRAVGIDSVSAARTEDKILFVNVK